MLTVYQFETHWEIRNLKIILSNNIHKIGRSILFLEIWTVRMVFLCVLMIQKALLAYVNIQPKKKDHDITFNEKVYLNPY